MVSKKGTKKTIKRTGEKPIVPAVEPIIEKPSLDPNLIKAVVEQLGPEINKKISASFDEIKGIVMSEIQKIQPRPVEQPVMEQPVMEQTVMEEPVMDQPVMDQQPPSIPGGLEALLPLIGKLLGEDKPTGQNGLMNMFMETMMRNTMANTARNDGMQDLMMKAAFKKILGEDVPKHITKTTEALTEPFMHYGDKAEAARNAAQNNL